VEEGRKIRILIASPGLDGHDRGAKVVALALKNAGMEVVYLGIHRTAEEIISAAKQEAADYIGLSMLSGAHLILAQQMLDIMATHHVEDISLIVGGTIPKRDIEKLIEMGVSLVFPTQTPLDTITASITEHAISPSNK
jgi:methylmalonyl-CoA mutase C-terminal domain/subunit